MNCRPITSTRHGFTRTDLLSTVCTTGLLGLLLVGSGSTTRTATEAAHCHNNTQRLIGAWLSHATENSRLLLNENSGSSQEETWAWGSLDPLTSKSNTNVATVQTKAFTPYIGTNTSVFRCPSDRLLYAAQIALGWQSRVRSYSMNDHVGTSIASWGGNFPTYRKLSDFSRPSETFVFAEEHPDSINDTQLATYPQGVLNPASARLIDFPASFHNRGAHFSFADGHIELHRWTGPRVVQPVRGIMALNIAAPNDPDALWLGQRAAQMR